MKKNKIFIAVDTDNISKAKKIIRETQTYKMKVGFKFGLQMLYSPRGRSFISSIKNKTTFIDVKLNDIESTMIAAIRSLKDLKINYLTVHINSGNVKTLKRVKKAAGKIKIAAVSVLTSHNNQIIKEIGHTKSVKKLVVHQAKLAAKANLDALVCSAREVKDVRKFFKKEIITPGIRFNSNMNDQKRVMTPKQAFKNGSDWLVIGRPITKGNIKNNLIKLINHLGK